MFQQLYIERERGVEKDRIGVCEWSFKRSMYVIFADQGWLSRKTYPQLSSLALNSFVYTKVSPCLLWMCSTFQDTHRFLIETCLFYQSYKSCLLGFQIKAPKLSVGGWSFRLGR